MGETIMYVHSAPLSATVAALRAGSLDVSQVVAEVCDRIDEIDPIVKALLPEPDRRARLLGEARGLSERYADTEDRPVLFGARLGVKDIFEVRGFVTRAGTRVPPSLWPMDEASSVNALRQAGALVVGKTVTTEFAYYEPGPTRNPHDVRHTPGGSSSGSAAAVAAGMCHLALGTQTIGSIIRPAAFCGIVGVKPTFGRVPTDGVLPFSRSADQIGLFTQDAVGALLATSVVCRSWDSVRAADAISEDCPVLGVPEGPYLDQAPPEALSSFEAQISRLQEAGFEVRRVPLLDDIADINRRHRLMVAAEMAEVHETWFAQYEELYRPRTADMIRVGQAADPAAVEEGRDGRWLLRDHILHVMDDSGVDVWVSPPALGPAPQGIDSTGDPIMNLPWTHAGLPTLTLPAGRAENGLPLGLQCAARWNADEELCGWAVELERALRET
jgi:Asp-tRNA(Asn)/Glu-tRNA(Gln) amidotransferase A subunit family amidase